MQILPEIPAPMITTDAFVYAFLEPILCAAGSYFGLAAFRDCFICAAMTALKIFLSISSVLQYRNIGSLIVLEDGMVDNSSALRLFNSLLSYCTSWEQGAGRL